MSAGGAFGGARGNAPKPPEKGVFPLDHLGECKEVGREEREREKEGGRRGQWLLIKNQHPPSFPQLKEAYTACLRAASADADACVTAARAYLDCRMARGLMARQSLDELGVEASGASGAAKDAPADDRVKTGFVAGLRPAKHR